MLTDSVAGWAVVGLGGVTGVAVGLSGDNEKVVAVGPGAVEPVQAASAVGGDGPEGQPEPATPASAERGWVVGQLAAFVEDEVLELEMLELEVPVVAAGLLSLESARTAR